MEHGADKYEKARRDEMARLREADLKDFQRRAEIRQSQLDDALKAAQTFTAPNHDRTPEEVAELKRRLAALADDHRPDVVDLDAGRR